MGQVIPFPRQRRLLKRIAPHDWGPTTLNHGTMQCRRCGCTDREAAYALGPNCEVKD